MSYKVGDVMEAEVKKIITPGAFLRITDKKDGFLHISELSDRRVERVEDYISEGQVLKVRIKDIDDQDRVRLELVNKADLDKNS